MKLTVKDDIGLPADAVFTAVTDFAAFEVAALKRGAQVSRLDGPAAPELGAGWDVRFKFRGRQRRIEARLVAFNRPRGFGLSGVSPNVTLALAVSVLALARDRSRLTLEIEVRPRTMAARLVIQTARLTRRRIERRLLNRLRAFDREMELRAARP